VAGNEYFGGLVHRKERKERESLMVISNVSNAGFELLCFEVNQECQFQFTAKSAKSAKV
jgi:hypothetical protein